MSRDEMKVDVCAERVTDERLGDLIDGARGILNREIVDSLVELLERRSAVPSDADIDAWYDAWDATYDPWTNTLHDAFRAGVAAACIPGEYTP